jgi:glycosyltransferase involved in cell wall biosynthesis
MPRILLTGFFGIPGPTRAGVQMRHVMRALSRHHDVDVLAVREPEQAHMERVGPARILRVPLVEEGLRPRVEGFRRALRRQIEGADYDVVHFRDGWSGSVVLEMREQHGYQTVFDATRAPVAEPPLMDLALSAELGRCEEACLAQAHHVLVPSALARDHVLRRRQKGVHVVPVGVDVDLFDWDDLPPGPPMVLYAGAVEAGRGLRGLLRAMATVAQRSDATLVIAGRTAPAAERSLLDAAAELGLSKRVELRGEVAHESMPELIAQATVCVAPSAVELSAQPMALVPTKILEYMACRRAVVAPRRGTVATVIEHDVSGMLFQPGDFMDMAYKLLALLHDSEARERLAGAGYDLVREYYTASAMRRALRRAYAAMQIHDTRPHRALTEVSGEIAPPEGAGAISRPATGPAAGESSESAQTDQIPVPFPGLPPLGPDAASGQPARAGESAQPARAGEAGDATDIELTQLPRADSERVITRDTVPDLGRGVGRGAVGNAAAAANAATAANAAAAAAGATAPGGPAPDGESSPPGEAGSGRRISSWDTFEMPMLQAPPSRPAPVAPRPRPAAPGRSDRDYRTVSGEVEVRAPTGGQGEIALQEEDESFTAVSVLLGGSKDEGE